MTSSTATENFSIAQTVQADRVDIQTLYLFYLFCPLFFLMIHLIKKNRFYKICMYFASYYLDQDRNKNNKNNSQPRNSPYTGASLVYGCSIYCMDVPFIVTLRTNISSDQYAVVKRSPRLLS